MKAKVDLHPCGGIAVPARAEIPIPLFSDGAHPFRTVPEGHFRNPARCGVYVYRNAARALLGHFVVLEERTKNPGTSVTDAIESVATAIDKLLADKVDGEIHSVALIEFYPHSLGIPESFSLVRFGQDKLAHGAYGNPEWYHLDRQEVERLIGKEAPRGLDSST